MKIHLLDIWGLNSERYIVTRHPDNFNMFCLISMGTGEILAHGSGYHIHRFLEGQNPLQAEYSRTGRVGGRGVHRTVALVPVPRRPDRPRGGRNPRARYRKWRARGFDGGSVLFVRQLSRLRRGIA